MCNDIIWGVNEKPLVSVIIVNLNGGQIFWNCLVFLSKIDYSTCELIVVDNGSSDDSLQRLKNFKYSNVQVIKNSKNLGFAKASNQGYEESRGEYILLLNNDTRVEKDFLAKLIKRIEEDKKIGIIQPKIKLMDKPTHLDSVGSFLTRTGFLQHLGLLQKDSNKFNKEITIFSAKGACMLIRREVIERVGLFDNDYGSYMEETDFCWRVWLAGYKILYYPVAVIYHKVGFTSKKQNQILVNYNSFKNRIATLYKNLNSTNLLLIGGTHLLILFLMSLYYLLRFEFGKSIMIIKAIIWNIKNIKHLSLKRKKVQNEIRVKSDSEIFNNILKPIDWKSTFSHFVRAEKMLQGEHEI